MTIIYNPFLASFARLCVFDYLSGSAFLTDGSVFARNTPFICGRVQFLFHRNSFDASRLIDDPLKQSANRAAVQRPVIDRSNVSDHFFFAIGRIDSESKLSLNPSKLNGALRASVEQLHQLLIESIDFVSPVFYVQAAPPILCSLCGGGESSNDGAARARFVDQVYEESDRPETNQRVSAPTLLTRAGSLAFCSISATIRLPTTAASACSQTSFTCSGVEIPNPTATGRSVNRFTRLPRFDAASDKLCLTPVTPVRETAYTKPVLASAINFRRSSVLVGATRKIKSMSADFNALRNSSASSGTRSVARTPSTPASFSSSPSRSRPIDRSGFK